MGAIYRRELQAYFTSPIAYIFLAVFNVFAGFYFYMTSIYMRTSDMSGTFGNMFMIMLFLMPILTMKLLSEERRQKTDQCLLTSPASLGEIVIGKYLASLTVFAISLVCFVLYAVILSGFVALEWTVFVGNLLGLFLLGGSFLSVGLLVSSLTENQVIAAIAGFLAMMVLYMVDVVSYQISNTLIKNLLMALSFYSRYSEFTTGIFNLSSVLYFISASVIFNFLTIRVLERRRWG